MLDKAHLGFMTLAFWDYFDCFGSDLLSYLFFTEDIEERDQQRNIRVRTVGSPFSGHVLYSGIACRAGVYG